MPRSTVDPGLGSSGKHGRPAPDAGSQGDYPRTTGRSIVLNLVSIDGPLEEPGEPFDPPIWQVNPPLPTHPSPVPPTSAHPTSGSLVNAGGDWPAHPPPTDQPRIAALLRLAQRGDGEAFGRIYDRYVDQVYRYLYYRLGSHALAEDLTSETFLRALRRLDSFAWQGRDIGAWFITIARNLVNDHVKSSRFRLEVATADLAHNDRGDQGIEEIVLGRLQNAVVLEAMRQLKPEQQECLILRFVQGLSLAETAHVMDRSEGAVKQLQLRAIRSLGRLLDHRNDTRADRNLGRSSSLVGPVGSRGRTPSR